MGKFIRDFLYFLSFLFMSSLLLLTIIILSYKEECRHIRFSEGISTLICGDSHPMCAINDSMLKKSVNISTSGQYTIFTYNVLKLLLDNNPQIKTVIFGVSFHSFGDNEHNILEDDRATLRYAAFFPIMDRESSKLLISRNFTGFLKSTDDITKTMIECIIKSKMSQEYSIKNYPFIGHFYNSRKNKLNDSTVMRAIKRHYYRENGKERGFAAYKLSYLKKIADLCRQKKIRLIMLNTPLSDLYCRKVPDNFISNYYDVMRGFRESAELWDFHSFYLEPHCFGDGDHMNAAGAEIFTMKIDSMLKNSNGL